ncbi:hypothetical protein Pint_21195 [Pistacia integerrima]|uniref:Uncharacterized protein n=1 Tax=Pistacia integerrima TaxID=434235 RepID=A0ACC0XA23_9ROSI|nr:hypothetical protein Pint_21195 [Pistacia integerrima]
MEVLARPLFKLTSTITPSKTCHTHFNNKSILLLPQLSAFSTFTFSASSRSLSPVEPVRHATPESQLSSDTREWVMQDFYTLRRDVEAMSAHVEEIRASAGLQQLEQELAGLESKAANSSFWDDRAKAQETLQALTDIKYRINLLTEFKTKVHQFSFSLWVTKSAIYCM